MEKQKNVCRSLSYLNYFIIFIPTVSDCVSTSEFDSEFVDGTVGIPRSAVELKLCTITERIKKKKKSVIKKRRKKHYSIVLLAKNKSNTQNVWLSKILIHSYINHDKLVSVNNLLKDYNEMKDKTKYRENAEEYAI